MSKKDEQKKKKDDCCQGDTAECCGGGCCEGESCCEDSSDEQCCGQECCENDVAKKHGVEKSKEEEYLEGWQRTLADFENYKKRQTKERSEFLEYACAELLSDLLPVVDNFDQAYAAVPKELQDNAWVKGIGFIQQQLQKLLEENGVVSMETKGKKFDESLHEAVGSTEKDEKMEQGESNSDGAIQKEVRKGYMYKEKVLRPARVVLSKKS